MKSLGLSRYALTIGAAAALLAGCSGSQPPIGAPGVMQQTSAIAMRTTSTNYKIVYSFGGGSDGANPEAGLIGVKGTLYGTTFAGGSYSCTYGNSGCGTVFSVTLDGTEKVLHDFGTGSDGQNPRAGLVDVGAVLYGTTSTGGSGCYISYHYARCGTVFSITRGTEKVLYSFTGGSDGAYPHAGLVDVNGTLYGTTESGGGRGCYESSYSGCGTVFSVTPDGTEKKLHGFDGPYGDGAYPYAGLIDVGSKFYGTTYYGGRRGYGTVFRITTGGREKVLHSFRRGANGGAPRAGLTDVGGVLYGTTSHGSTGNSGAVYAITRSGAERVLYLFDGKQGRMPYGNLIEFHNTLWGTTEQGGVDYGTVFSITTSGELTTIYSFKGSGKSDGENPFAGLVELNGTLYGTTEYGGPNNTGTVFSITAAGQENVIYSFGVSSSGDGAHPASALFVYKG
ncbi:MAG: choice-of-anchor tandem repeat GloVer-containing protein, partial [Candidatus Cybelea sp.]